MLPFSCPPVRPPASNSLGEVLHCKNENVQKFLTSVAGVQVLSSNILHGIMSDRVAESLAPQLKEYMDELAKTQKLARTSRDVGLETTAVLLSPAITVYFCDALMNGVLALRKLGHTWKNKDFEWLAETEVKTALTPEMKAIWDRTGIIYSNEEAVMQM